MFLFHSDNDLHLLPGAQGCVRVQRVDRQKPFQLIVGIGHPLAQRLDGVAGFYSHDIDIVLHRRPYRGRIDLASAADGRWMGHD